ncbi:MAG: hypothetical protein JHC63_07905 [Acidimicrobiia bacterium]|nr:hypothetical protein [Acidimicrobiia bacterium]
MAIAVLVIVGGFIVGVIIELTLSKRRGAGRIERVAIDLETLLPSTPQAAEPRIIEDGEGFRVIGPVDYDDGAAAPWESDDGLDGPSAQQS